MVMFWRRYSAYLGVTGAFLAPLGLRVAFAPEKLCEVCSP